MKRTKIILEFNYSLVQLKNAMRKFFGYDKNVKISKKDVQIWMESLLKGYIEDNIKDK